MTEPHYEIDIDFDEQAFDEEAPLSPPEFFDEDYDYADYLDAGLSLDDLDEDHFDYLNVEWDQC